MNSILLSAENRRREGILVGNKRGMLIAALFFTTWFSGIAEATSIMATSGTAVGLAQYDLHGCDEA